MTFRPVSLLRNLASLAEGPCWHPGEGALYFTESGRKNLAVRSNFPSR